MVVKRDVLYWPANQERRLHIWLPDDYYESQERYPVMYMFDGHNLYYDEDTTYGTSWGMANFLLAWPKRMIIVGMECSHEGNARLSEYCPYDKKMFGNEVKGMGEETFQWIIDTVKPLIDKEYRTYSHREATAIGGSSMGGLMSIYGVIAHNDVFSKAACVSTGLIRSEYNLHKEFNKKAMHPDTRVYMSWGTEEMGGPGKSDYPIYENSEAGAACRMAEKIRNHGADAEIYCQWGGRHFEADWEKQVPRFMEYLWMNRKF